MNTLDPSAKPLCVDLDGTLVKTDTFVESLVRQIRMRPAKLLSLPFALSRGRAALKERLAREVPVDPASLPLHRDLPALLRSEREKGRPLILVTAADQQTACTLADHLGIFSDVMASDGTTNLKAGRKRDALVARFGEKGFDYAGNSLDDLPVWKSADRMIVVNPPPGLRHARALRTATILDDRPPLRSRWLRALRTEQWLKNVLVFLPMLLAHELTTPALYAKTALAFLAFSLAASAVYLGNDLFDLDADRHHPRKKNRPLAAGDVGLLSAAAAGVILAVSALALSLLLPALFSGVLLVYLLLTTLYSMRFKQIALLDVITLAGLYALRILAGSAASGIESSPWLIAFSIFVFFSLALVKRYAELRETDGSDSDGLHPRGRGYRAADLPLLAAFGAGSGCTAVLILALYINSTKVLEFYHRPHSLWLLCPLFLYWIARVWILAARGELTDDPLAFAVRDRITWLVAALSAATLLLAAI